jgi:hypothetical protein
MIQQTDDAKKLAPRMGGDGDLDQYLQNIWSQRDLRPVGGAQSSYDEDLLKIHHIYLLLEMKLKLGHITTHACLTSRRLVPLHKKFPV